MPQPVKELTKSSSTAAEGWTEVEHEECKQPPPPQVTYGPLLTKFSKLLTMRDPTDLRSVLWVILYYTLTYGMWKRFDEMSWGSLGLSMILLSYFSFSGATITHNTMHSKVFDNEVVNKIFQISLSMMYGHPVSTFIPGHNLSHHRYTQLLEDPMRTSKLRYSWNFLNGLLFHYTVASDVFKGDMRFLMLQKHLGRKFYSNCVREFCFVGLQALVGLYLSPLKFVLLVYIPHFFGQWAIVTVNLLQHDGCDVVEYEDQRKNYNGSRNFVGELINFLTFNNGFHTIHHLFPALHWSRLREAHDQLVAPHIHEKLDQQCMGRYIFQAFFSPGLRVDFNGAPVSYSSSPPEQEDRDWIEKYYPEGKDFEDFSFEPDIFFLLKALPLLPVKIICPTYSPVFKVF